MARKKSPVQLDREIAEALAPRGKRAHAAVGGSSNPFGVAVGDAVQLRWEPGTAGVVRRFLPDAEEGRTWAEVATSSGPRKVPADALRPVRKEHEDRVRRSVGKARAGHATKRETESYASVHRKASREADRRMLSEELDRIYDAMYVVAAGPKIYMYGSKDEAQEFMRGLPRYADGKLIEIRSITAKEQQDLARNKRQAFRNP